MTILNADGSEAEMCGNGIRCLGAFLIDLGFSTKPYTIETKERMLSISFTPESEVSVDMGAPTDERWDMEIDGQVLHYLNTGVPHAVLFVSDLDAAAVEEQGAYFRRHPTFQPKGANINFVEVVDSRSIRARTYERGVEGETLACGTGATACAIAAAKVKGLTPPIRVIPRSDETLTICFSCDKEVYTNVTMTGPVRRH